MRFSKKAKKIITIVLMGTTLLAALPVWAEEASEQVVASAVPYAKDKFNKAGIQALVLDTDQGELHIDLVPGDTEVKFVVNLRDVTWDDTALLKSAKITSKQNNIVLKGSSILRDPKGEVTVGDLATNKAYSPGDVIGQLHGIGYDVNQMLANGWLKAQDGIVGISLSGIKQILNNQSYVGQMARELITEVFHVIFDEAQSEMTISGVVKDSKNNSKDTPVKIVIQY